MNQWIRKNLCFLPNCFVSLDLCFTCFPNISLISTLGHGGGIWPESSFRCTANCKTKISQRNNVRIAICELKQGLRGERTHWCQIRLLCSINQWNHTMDKAVYLERVSTYPPPQNYSSLTGKNMEIFWRKWDVLIAENYVMTLLFSRQFLCWTSNCGRKESEYQGRNTCQAASQRESSHCRCTCSQIPWH